MVQDPHQESARDDDGCRCRDDHVGRVADGHGLAEEPRHPTLDQPRASHVKTLQPSPDGLLRARRARSWRTCTTPKMSSAVSLEPAGESARRRAAYAADDEQAGVSTRARGARARLINAHPL